MSEQTTTLHRDEHHHAPAPGQRPSGRHPVRVIHLVAGLTFVGLALVWALVQGGALQADDLRWLVPLPFLVAGTAGLAVVAAQSRRRASAPLGNAAVAPAHAGASTAGWVPWREDDATDEVRAGDTSALDTLDADGTEPTRPLPQDQPRDQA